jgi:hypothetical protein
VKKKASPVTPASRFHAAVDAADHLQWRAGLQAVKPGEGKGLISANAAHLLGGACIDHDCRAAHPRSARWDYVIGVERSAKPVAHFIEVHSAETCEVSKMADKLAWLRTYLEAPAQSLLAKLQREYHWVASGRINIPKNTPQYRALNSNLRKLGLKGPVKHLTLA